MTVNGVNNTSSVAVVPRDQQGFAGLTSDDFLRLLIVQLQNQDPTNPLESDQLLSQMSDMRSLQASIELKSALESLTLSQQLTSSSAFIGRTITGTATDRTGVNGVVNRVQLRDGKAYLSVGTKEVELKDVLSVAA
jgi:flagellar basal-body rod modification protein FlgD